MRFPRAILALAGCIALGFGVTAVLAHVNHGVWIEVLFGIFIVTLVSFYASLAYLAPKYGTKAGRVYTFDDGSPMSLFIPLGIVLVCLEGGVLYCISRHLW